MPLEFVGGAWWPERRTWALGHPVLNVTNPYALGSEFTGFGIVVPAPRTGTLTGYGVYLSTANEFGVPPSPSLYQFSLQGVDPATGRPDGSNLISHTMAITGDGLRAAWTRHTWYTADMSPGTYEVTRGDLVACTLHWAHEGATASAFWMCCQQPQNLQGPPWPTYLHRDDGTWTLGGGAPYMPLLVLIYEDGATAVEGPLPSGAQARLSFPYFETMGPAGMSFTVPRSLGCRGIAFHMALPNGATLTLSEGSTVLRTVTLPASAAYDDWEFPFADVLLRPGRTYTATLTSAAGPFNLPGYRSVAGPAGTGIPNPADQYPDAWPGWPEALDTFEGGPTWVAHGDDADEYDPAAWGSSPPLTTRWFMYLHLSGSAVELGVPLGRPADCAGFTPVPCEQVCPPEPDVAMTASLLAQVQRRRRAQQPPRVLPLVAGPAGFRSPLWLLGLGGAPVFTPPDLAFIPPGATFTSTLCAQTCPAEPPVDLTSCTAPLGAFRLALHCLGPDVTPAVRRARALHQAVARRRQRPTPARRSR